MKLQMHGRVKQATKEKVCYKILVEDRDLGSCIMFITPKKGYFPSVGANVEYTSEARPDDFTVDGHLTVNLMKATLER